MKATKADLFKKVAKLESINDQLLAELAYVDQLMRSVGFAHGLATVKATAMELIEQGQREISDEEGEIEEAC